jgi:PAT family beta-lactamase induction signal transducer AmpG
MAPAPVAGRSRWRDVLRAYTEPRMLSMLALGFSSGLPFMLVYGTLSAWLRQAGIERSTIGMLAWVSLVYTFKFLWAPVVDRARLPLLGRWLGQRRSWMLLAQTGIAASLVAMAQGDPAQGVARFALLALCIAFCSATQDICIDAWRIESAPTEQQGAMASAYQFGYLLALKFVASAAALLIASQYGWHVSYGTMAALVAIGFVTTLLVREPERRAPQVSVYAEARVVEWLARRAHWPESWRQAGGWLVGAIVCPITDFFARFGLQLGLIVFGFVSLYRLTDFTMGVMANPFYLDTGFTLAQVAAIAKVYGTLMSFLGVVVGGIAVTRLGRMRSLLLGSLLVIASNLAYAAFANLGRPSPGGLALIISIDNLAIGVHGTALIAFLSSLTSAAYTATQYAVLSSLYALPGKLLMGTSGIVVDHVGYPVFFAYTASLSLPALLLLWLLWRRGGAPPGGAEPALRTP